MKIARTVVRIVLGVLFVFGGASAFFMAQPPQPGVMGEFIDAFARSHYQWFVAVAQIVMGGLFLANRYMMLAIVMMGAFMYNSLAFHLTMAPPTVVVPVIVIALLVFVAWPYRAVFGQLFAAQPPADSSSAAASGANSVSAA